MTAWRFPVSFSSTFFSYQFFFVSLLHCVLTCFSKESKIESKLQNKYYVEFIILAQICYQVCVNFKTILNFYWRELSSISTSVYNEIEKRVQHLLKTYNHKFHPKKQATATGLEPTTTYKRALLANLAKSLKLQISCLFWARSSLTFRQL